MSAKQKYAFGRYLTATGLTTFGDVISMIAMPVIAYTVLDSSAFIVAALIAVEQISWLLIGLPAGVLVDRWSRKRVLVLGGVLRAVLLISIPLAWFTSALTLIQLFVVAFGTGLISVFTMTANTAYLPSLVPKEHLVHANSRLSVVETATDTAGQAIAGFIIQAIKAPVAIFVEAVVSLASALLIQSTRETVRQPIQTENASTFWGELKAGIVYTLGHPTFRTILATNVLWNVAMAGQFAIAVPFLVDILRVEEGLIGIAFTVGGIGGLVGALAVSRLSDRFGSGAVWRTSLLLAPIVGLLVPLSALAHGIFGVVLYGLGTAALGAGIAMVSVITGAARQAICPPEMLGRLGSVSQFITWGIIPVGALLFGALGSLLGLAETMWAVAITFFLCAVVARLSPLWTSPKIEVALD
ncbi:MFS transporter [Citricoccus sp. NR2]|uniref:MFS transporter n=1 Tax=Citricoccus sp. NR2 TaxID=3004095 RepID=UPI0022DD4D4F|nr:MFS transporter [Citricoccus sp. NR2]WBL20049.1 MFS transporter [Citricoccus sp. NR2]